MSLIIGVGAHAQYSDKLIVEKLLTANTNSIGQKINYPNVKNAEVSIQKITFPPGSSTGWHQHEIPVFSYILKGKLTVEIEGHKTVTYSEGECFAETFNTIHQGSNKTKEDLVVLAIYLGGDHKPHSIKKSEK